tara:strand:+ start:12484 stop:12693 length:210 start_codon:yes stop_codon:yes gene_type:complete
MSILDKLSTLTTKAKEVVLDVRYFLIDLYDTGEQWLDHLMRKHNISSYSAMWGGWWSGIGFLLLLQWIF